MTPGASGLDAVLSLRTDGAVVILDGAMGTELERPGVPMDADAWCGADDPATTTRFRSICWWSQESI